MSTAMLTAVVLNWRTPDHTVRAVRALIADGLSADRVVIADNASGDDSVERFRSELPGSILVELPENIGFARANNAAARVLPSHTAYLFVNSDAFVHAEGSVSQLLRALDDDRVGIAVPRLLNEDGSLQRNVVPPSTPLPELVRASGLSRFIPNGLQPFVGTYWDHSHSRMIQAAIGPVVLVRARAWEQLGGFHEHPFMYAEDLDLFWRAARLGWRARFIAEAEFTHLGGASSARRWSTPERAERIARTEAELIRDRLGPVRSRVTIGLMAVGVGGRAVVHRVSGNRAAAETQRAWLRGYLTKPATGRAPRA